jgi:hypothetical protein
VEGEKSLKREVEELCCFFGIKERFINMFGNVQTATLYLSLTLDSGLVGRFVSIKVTVKNRKGE